MFLFVAGILVFAVGVFGFLRRERISDEVFESDSTIGVAVVAWVAIIGGFLMVGGSVTTVVPTRNIAVTTAYGKPTGTIHNGIHIIAPWESVTDYDATIQTLDMSGSDDTPAVDVRIANNNTAKMNVIVNWRIDPNADIQQLHLDWRDFGSLQRRVVVPRLQTVLNRTFESYDPLIALRDSDGTPQLISSFEPTVKDKLQAAMPRGILIDTVQIPLVNYPPQVQEALNNFQKELAATQVAKQQQKTAEAQKTAIQTLNSVTLSPEAFAMQCLIMTERLAQQGHTISQTWSCVAGLAGAVALK